MVTVPAQPIPMSLANVIGSGQEFKIVQVMVGEGDSQQTAYLLIPQAGQSPPPVEPVPVVVVKQEGETILQKPTRRTRGPKRTPLVHLASICTNCYTTETCVWRRNQSGEPECNACNQYMRKNGVPRPLHLAGKGVNSRKRVVVKREEGAARVGKRVKLEEGALEQPVKQVKREEDLDFEAYMGL